MRLSFSVVAEFTAFVARAFQMPEGDENPLNQI
jgi:hypothetical protein